MFQVNPRRVCLLVAACLALAAISVPAPAQMAQKLSFKKMVENSDLIVVGQCTERKVDVQDGKLIVTEYTVKPSEFWKGGQTLGSDGTFKMTEIGGSLSERPGNKVPLAQFAPAMSNMAAGEEVLLFLANPPKHPAGTRSAKAKAAAPARAKSAGFRSTSTLALTESPQVVGGWQGRFSVVTHPMTGGKMVTRSNISAVPGSPINTAMRDKLLQAQGIKSVPSATGGKVAVQDASVKLSADKMSVLTHQIDQAAILSRRQHDEQVQQAKTPDAGDDIYSFESIEAVKASVLKYAKSSRP